MEWSDEGIVLALRPAWRKRRHPRSADPQPRPPSRSRARRLLEQRPRPAPAGQPREAHLARAARGKSRHLCRRARAGAGERHVRGPRGARGTERVLRRRRCRCCPSASRTRPRSKAPMCCSTRWRVTASRIGRRSSCAGRSASWMSSASASISHAAPPPDRPTISSMSRRARAAPSRAPRAKPIAIACSRCRRSCSAARRASRTRAMRSRGSS